MGFADANSLLSGPRQPIAKFDNVGDSVTGTLVDAEVAPVTSPTGEAQLDKNGNPRQQIIYTLQTDERDAEIDDDNGQRRVFAKWAIQKAISTCLTDAGLSKTGLQEGGKLTITHTGTQKASQRGYSDIKLYEASYTPPPARPHTLRAQVPGEKEAQACGIKKDARVSCLDGPGETHAEIIRKSMPRKRNPAKPKPKPTLFGCFIELKYIR